MEYTEIGVHWHELTEEETKLIKDQGDCPIISMIDGLSNKEKEEIYHCIKIKQEYFNDFMIKQKKWLADREFFIDLDLRENHLEDTHEVIEKIITQEMLQDKGQNIRFKIYYAVTCREKIGTPYDSKLENFFNEVDETIEKYKLI